MNTDYGHGIVCNKVKTKARHVVADAGRYSLYGCMYNEKAVFGTVHLMKN